jgi:8-oxo-dGTP pyrophosphatase MutT (NUDIX family)
MDNHLIELVRLVLRDNLPGKHFQEKKAPSHRREIPLGKRTVTRQSAVMVLLYLKENKYHTAFIKRQEYNGPHSGQISFPGGKQEPGETLVETALRETHEEIGVEPGSVNILGGLTKLFIPVSNLEVFPFVGFCPSPPHFSPHTREVQYIIEVPLDNILSPRFSSIITRYRDDIEITVPLYTFANEEIWGATAMITSELEEVIRRTNQISQGSI